MRNCYAWVLMRCMLLTIIGIEPIVYTLQRSNIYSNYPGDQKKTMQEEIELAKHIYMQKFIHSFIADIYIAPLQVGLLRSAPNPMQRGRIMLFYKLLKEFLAEYSI